MFRKLYWVTEQLNADGHSQVVGCYTSIFDLVDKGLRWDDEVAHRDGFRVNLVKLDSGKRALGTWNGPEFSGMEDALQTYVGTGEMTAQEVENLAQSARKFCAGVTA